MHFPNCCMLTLLIREPLLALAGFLLLSGCLQGPVGWQRVTLNQTISPKEMNDIVNGETTLSTVIEKIGAPNEMFPSGQGMVTRYYFTNSKYFRADFGWGLRFILPFFAPSLILGGGGIGTDVFQVTYSNEWIVQDHAFAFHAHSSEFLFWPFRD